jgi:tetratricopeptide (TPR) repeat protein
MTKRLPPLGRVACLALLLAGACAPKTVPPLPTVSAPQFPDFVAPVVPVAFANSAAAAAQARGWTFLQAGDLKNAEREFSSAVKATPDFYPAEISLGYVELARKDASAAPAALSHFDKVLKARPADTSALVGRGQASLALKREADALAAFDAAVAADPSLVDVSRRADVLRFRSAQAGLANARAAARAGRLDEAIRAYAAAIASSPGSSFLYRELAVVEREHGDVQAALDHFRKAVELDAADASSLVQIGELLEAGGDLDGAAKAYSAALAVEPNADVQARLEMVRARADVARLPAEYRAIGDTAQVTRGELAALVGVRLAPLLEPDRRLGAVVITDLRNQWAATWIVTVSRAGVMDPFANHTFQPRTLVRRVELAQTVARLLARIAVLKPAKAKAWESARLMFSDLAPSHLAYRSASASIASGVILPGPDGAFQPNRTVSGAEAIDVMRRLEALADLPVTPVGGQR